MTLKQKKKPRAEGPTNFFGIDLDKYNFFDDGGYLYFSCPKHPLAQQNGAVAVHRHLMSVQLGRWLGYDDMIYFVNRNPKDVSLENLQVVSRQEFFKLVVAPDGWEPKAEIICRQCKKPFVVAASQKERRHHCSKECMGIAQRLFEVSPEELHDLVWSMPTTHIAAEFKVSDKAIEKRCKKLGVEKPPRGYWAKVNAGKIDPLANKPPFMA